MEIEKEIAILKSLLKESVTPGTTCYCRIHYHDMDVSDLCDTIINNGICPRDYRERLYELLLSFFESYQGNKDFDNSFDVFYTGLNELALKEKEDPYIKTLEGKLRLCKNCLQPIPFHDVDLSNYDFEKCEGTGINDRCYLFGIRCRDVKTPLETCRNVKPEPTWIDELVKRNNTHKFMVDGKVNHNKLKRELKKHGAHWAKHEDTDDYRGGVARARYFFIRAYLVSMGPRADRKFCSEKCRRAYHNKKK